MKQYISYLLLLPFLHLVFSLPLENEVKEIENATVTTASEIEHDPIAVDLEKYVATIPEESFEGDHFLIQFLDILNGVTTFRHVDPLRQEFAVYNTGYNERTTPQKQIYVLRKNEDRIRIFKSKRVYVVLRRFSKDKRFFYVSNVYLKKSSTMPNSKSVELGGERFYLEWDIWEHRGGNEHKATLFGQLCCKSSIFVSCQNKDTIDFPKAVLSLKNEPSESLNFVAGKIALSNANDPDEDLDFFYDLDDDTEMSRYVGSKIYNLLHRASAIKGRTATASNGPGGAITQIISSVFGVMNSFVEVGMGLMKSFGGMFGGLGTGNANTKSVFSNVDIKNPEIFEERMPDNVYAQVDVAVKIAGSGGLGGFINKDEKNEKPNEVLDAVFEADSGDPSGGRGLLDFLPEKMKDPMTDEVVEKVVDSVLYEIDTFKHNGWKTMGMKAQQGVTLTHENEAFVGFGACNFNETTSAISTKAQSAEDIISALQMAIGTCCVKSKSEELASLIKEGYLTLTEHQSLQLSDTLPHLLEDKLPSEKLSKLLQAYEVSVFSEVYLAELRASSKDLTAPDGLKISHSVHTLGVYAKNAIIALKTSRLRKHHVKICRSLARTLKTFLLKLLEDKIILETCLGCSDETETNYNDSVYLMGLIQFIFKGLSPVNKGEDVHKSFQNFYQLNKPVLEGKVKSYYN